MKVNGCVLVEINAYSLEELFSLVDKIAENSLGALFYQINSNLQIGSSS